MTTISEETNNSGTNKPAVRVTSDGSQGGTAVELYGRRVAHATEVRIAAGGTNRIAVTVVLSVPRGELELDVAGELLRVESAAEPGVASRDQAQRMIADLSAAAGEARSWRERALRAEALAARASAAVEVVTSAVTDPNERRKADYVEAVAALEALDALSAPGGDDERSGSGPAAEDADRAWRDRMAAGQDQLLQIAREQAGSLSAIASAARTIAGGADKRTGPDPDPAAEAPEQPWFRMSWQAGHAIPRLARDLRAIHAAAGRYPVPSWRDASERERNSWYAVALRAVQIAEVAPARALDEVDPGGVPPNGGAFSLLSDHAVMLKNEWRKIVDK